LSHARKLSRKPSKPRSNTNQSSISPSNQAVLARLLEGHNALVQIVNGNNQSFSRMVQHLELRLNACATVLEELNSGSGVKGLDSSGIDWKYYLEDALVKMKAEIAAMKEAAKLSGPPAEEAPLDEDEPIEFGGTNG
jgi:uncharacterized protein (UPF0261 family)